MNYINEQKQLKSWFGLTSPRYCKLQHCGTKQRMAKMWNLEQEMGPGQLDHFLFLSWCVCASYWLEQWSCFGSGQVRPVNFIGVASCTLSPNL